ncbi:hypothetical protein P7K49_003181 [Saguinus oedipus]|uniref:Uncharacterized protein n=1 Tax=Saguinus oedipus TaxID=9490 RepID=A0ABQ9WJY2_SAGOE|nr:hypothetical protein P7K49_003181 [Saguinus oedipus]
MKPPHKAAGLQRPLSFSDGAVSGTEAPGLATCSSSLLRQEKTDTVRCIKSCRPNDVTCVFDPVHTISHTVVSLPTFREFSRPEGEWKGVGVPGSPGASLGFS